jgi:hypothetical protein
MKGGFKIIYKIVKVFLPQIYYYRIGQAYINAF